MATFRPMARSCSTARRASARRPSDNAKVATMPLELPRTIPAVSSLTDPFVVSTAWAMSSVPRRSHEFRGARGIIDDSFHSKARELLAGHGNSFPCQEGTKGGGDRVVGYSLQRRCDCISLGAVSPRGDAADLHCRDAWVKVPVLSTTTMSTFANRSRASGRVTRRPRRASRVVAAATAAGVASDKAQGQVTTSTANAAGSAREGSTKSQNVAAHVASVTVSTTNQEATRSAVWAIEARSACVRSSSPTMLANIDSDVRVVGDANWLTYVDGAADVPHRSRAWVERPILQ